MGEQLAYDRPSAAGSYPGSAIIAMVSLALGRSAFRAALVDQSTEALKEPSSAATGAANNASPSIHSGAPHRR